MDANTIEWVTDDAGFIFEAARRKREAEARELLGGYVAASETERDILRAGWVDLLLSRQVIADDEHRKVLNAKHEAFMDKLDADLDAFVGNPGDEQRASLTKTYRSFVRRLVLPHHYL
ncbi:hypothetical protein G3N95_24315 [Paraburkholderia sp. Tr-20389]|uniref:hypothetical protein n=1 Tax=Paraburkholderia sp. Tr-20389 TaxID=2703903 RepID=UPI0019800388|nr:hypothetical protein [Paraburkholderia sp. Tr-20389]MBN3756087.1 hypothetical protein [Paraburkholderia sp. Tr-20389]